MAAQLYKNLATAIQGNNAKEVRRLISEGADPNETVFPKKRTAVHLAVEKHAHAALEVLCQMNGDGTRRDAEDIQPIELALRLSDKKALRILQECLKKYKKDEKKLIPTNIAPTTLATKDLTSVEREHLVLFKKLLEFKSPEKTGEEFTTFLLNHLDDLRKLSAEEFETLENLFSTKPKVQKYRDGKIKSITTFLPSDKEMVLKYLYHRPDVFGHTNPLFYFANKENRVMVDFLLKEGIFNINTRSINDEFTLIGSATLAKADKMTLFLVQQPGIDWDARTFPNITNTIAVINYLKNHPENLDDFRKIKHLLPRAIHLYLAEDLGREIYVYAGHGSESCDSEGNVIEFPVPPGNIVVQMAQCGVVSRALNQVLALLIGLKKQYAPMFQDPLAYKSVIEDIVSETTTTQFKMPRDSLRIYFPGDMLTLQGFYPASFYDTEPGKGKINLRQSGLISKKKILSSKKDNGSFLNEMTIGDRLNRENIPLSVFERYYAYSEYPTFHDFIQKANTLYPKEDKSSYTPADSLSYSQLDEIAAALKKTNKELMQMYPGVHYNLNCRYIQNPQCRSKQLLRRRKSMDHQKTHLYNTLRMVYNGDYGVKNISEPTRRNFYLQRLNEAGKEPIQFKDYESSEIILFLSHNVEHLKSVLTPADIEKIQTEAKIREKHPVVKLAIDILFRRADSEMNNPAPTAIGNETNPLVIFTKRGSTGMVKYLLDHGANPNQLDSSGEPVFLIAMNRAFSGVVHEFLKRPDLRLDMKTMNGKGATDFIDKLDKDVADIFSQKMKEKNSSLIKEIAAVNTVRNNATGLVNATGNVKINKTPTANGIVNANATANANAIYTKGGSNKRRTRKRRQTKRSTKSRKATKRRIR